MTKGSASPTGIAPEQGQIRHKALQLYAYQMRSNVRRRAFLDSNLHEAKVCAANAGKCHLAAVLVAVDDARHWEPSVQDLIRLQLGRLQRDKCTDIEQL